MAREKIVQKNGRGGPISAVEGQDPSIMYLIMPSYAEPYKRSSILSIQKKRNDATTKLSKMFLKMLISILLLLTAKILNNC